VKVVLVDFYDSFTFNLVHYLEQLDAEVTVIRHDYLNLAEINSYDAIVLSPGPGLPNEKVNLQALLQEFVGVKPILGVCLGMQALAEHIGGTLVNQEWVKHGVQESMHVSDHSGLFEGLPSDYLVGLYHSWKVVDVPESWQTSHLENGVLMSLEVPDQQLYAVQFHPESILTEHGLSLLSNFIQTVKS
jgi:anthranilate synthase component 2